MCIYNKHIKTKSYQNNSRPSGTNEPIWYSFWCRMALQLPLVVLPTLQFGPDIDWWLVSVVLCFGDHLEKNNGWFQICLQGWTFGWQCVKLKQFSHANWIRWMNVLSYPIFHEAGDVNKYVPFQESQPRQFECVGTQASPAQRNSHHSNRQPMVLPGNSRPGRVHHGQHAGLEPSFPPPKLKAGLTWIYKIKKIYILKFLMQFYTSTYISKPFPVRVDVQIHPV